jgi:hypothetical protein
MANSYRKVLEFEITCEALDWQLSAVAQVLNPLLSSLPTLESLEISIVRDEYEDCPGEMDDIQWGEVLHLFTSVKKMSLSGADSVRRVAPVLQELAGERATEVLPTLQNLFLRTYGWQPSGPVEEAIERFIATRRLCGRPVTVHY